MRRMALAILLIYLVVAGLIAGGAAVLVARDREQELHRAEGEMTSQVRVLEEHVARSLGQIDTVLAAVTAEVAGRDGLAALGERPTHELTRSWLLQTPQVSAMMTGDADGMLFSDTRVFPVPRVPLASGEALARLRDDRSFEMHIHSPLRGRDDLWVIPVSRRVETATGDFAGFVWATVNPQYFEQFYRDIRLNVDDTISVATRDGVLLVNFPAQEGRIGQRFQPLPPFGPPELHTTRVALDVRDASGQFAIVASRMLESYPLVVQLSRPRDTALRAFHANTERLVWGVGLLLSLLGLLAWVVFEDIHRREMARRTLQKLAQTLEERVRQRTAELETSNRELLAFSYSVSHDLRAPLRAINGFSHALLEDYCKQLDATGRDYLERVARASIRMGELIDELLKLANVARQPLEIREVDVSALAQEIADDLRAAAPDHPAVFDIQPAMRAEADETLLRNVLGNLLDNAWKFSRERPDARICVDAEVLDEVVLFRVSDNGVGFDMVYAGRLFQPFQQLHTGKQYKGTGIGLASARRIVERHGGRIWAESQPGNGTTILFTLPRLAAVIRKRR